MTRATAWGRLTGALIMVIAVAGLSSSASAQTPKEIVLGAVDAEAAAQHKRITVKTRLDGKQVDQSWVIESSDRVCFSQRMPDRAFAMCLVGHTAYLREGPGWIQAPLGTPAVPNGTTDWVRRAFDNTLSEVAFLGVEVAAGLSVQHYAARVDYRDAFGRLHGRADLWIDATSGLPVRSTFAGRYADRHVSTEKTVEYDPAITVSIPAPILNP